MAFLEYQPRSPLYYYSDVRGFEGIIRSKQLWLSDVVASNDPRELKVGNDLVAEIVEAYRGGIHGVSRQDLNRFLFQLLHAQKHSRLYTCCFALDGDSRPLWQEYGDNHKGLSIGFRPTAITSMVGRLQLVKYDSDPDIRDHFEAAVRAAAMHMGTEESTERAMAVAGLFASITALKHRSWEHEKEVRLIYNQRIQKSANADKITPYTGELEDGSMIEWREPSVRTGRGGRQVHYQAFEFGKRSNRRHDASRAIETVFIGDRCDMNDHEVRALLRAEGYEGFEIHRSECEIQ